MAKEPDMHYTGSTLSNKRLKNWLAGAHTPEARRVITGMMTRPQTRHVKPVKK